MVYIKTLLLLSLAFLITVPAQAQHCGNCPSSAKAAAIDSSKAKGPEFRELPGYGKKVWIGQEFYFTYKFDKKPKMGTSILKVALFDKKNKPVKDWEMVGKSGMPSMAGAHDAEAAFKLNKKGDYLLPVNFVMPGEWEVRLTFKKDATPVYYGSFRLTI